MKRTALAFFLFWCLLFESCSSVSTKVTYFWKDPTYTAGLKKVLIIGLSKQESVRRMFESNFASELSKQGTAPTPSYTIFHSSGAITRDSLQSVISNRIFDTVLITRLVSVKDKRQYVPGAGDPTWDDMWGYYGLGWNYMYSPGYMVDDTQVILETNLYSTADSKLIWAAQSRTISYNGSSGVIKSFINAIIEKMKNDNLI